MLLIKFYIFLHLGVAHFLLGFPQGFYRFFSPNMNEFSSGLHFLIGSAGVQKSYSFCM